MKYQNEKCEECNGHITYENNTNLYRCDECGSITDSEGLVIYDVQTLYEM